MSEVKRFKAVINDKPYKPYAYCEESSDGIYVRHEDYAALQQDNESNLKSAQYSAETNRKVVRANEGLSDKIAALQQKLDAVLAENVAIRAYLSRGSDDIKISQPETDAILNAVRAEAQREFCQNFELYGKVEPYHFDPDFAELYAKISKRTYDGILDNPAVYDMESLVDWLEQGAADSRAYADMAIEHAAQLRAGNTEGGV